MKETLAVFGGKPIRNEYLHFHRPSFNEDEENEMLDTLRSGWLTTSKKTKLFEEMFADYCNAKFAIGVTSCTAALHLSLVALGIGAGDEVITTPMTFIATANVILDVGAIPVFVDIDPQTLNIDVDKIEEKITDKTKAIIPVHYIGLPCEMDELMKIARKHNLYVIEDAAHATETVYKSQKVGSIGDITSFSFYATKNITTGEGGMITTNNEEWAEKLMLLRTHGMTRDAWQRYSSKGNLHYDQIYLGYKYNMFDIQAALGIPQLKKIEQFWTRRNDIVHIYNDAFKNIEEIEPVYRQPESDTKNANHLYVIKLKTEMLKTTRDDIAIALQEENIGVGIHYKPVHLQTYYQNTLGTRKGLLPVTEDIGERILTLPLYPAMSNEDLNDVIYAIRKVINWYKK